MAAIGKRVIRTVTAVLDSFSRRLVNKLILLFSTIIILVVASLTVISYQMIERESVQNSIASTSNNLLLVNQNLEDYLAGMEQLSLPQIRYDEITNAILNESSDYSARMYLEDYLRSLYFSRNDLSAICLYVVDQKKVYSILRENYNITVRVADAPNIPGQPWYKQAMASEKNRSFQSLILPGAETGYKVDTKLSFMAYHRVLRSIVTRKPQAVISFYYKSSGLTEIMKDVPFAGGEHLLLLDSDNVPYYVDDMAYYRRIHDAALVNKIRETPAGQFTWSDGDSRYLVVYNVGVKEGWKLIKPIPYEEIYQAATTTRNLSFLIGFIFLLVSLVLVTYFANAITKPLKKLSHHMSRFSAGTFDAEAPVKGRDEIAFLSRHFNEMVRNTNELINERYKMKLVEKNAILKALEAEINPHFLYNALQAISTKALKNDRFDIADMVDALALTLRYCISGKDIVPAREELKHIERYLSLQIARFGSRLQVEIDWEESLMELQIPKLSVQSLVENSIKHALERVSSTITIVIRAQADGNQAIISVKDNGPGIPPERLEQVLESFKTDWEERENDNIGLTNLNTRLKLLYGEEAGLVIQTNESGTEMGMLIPRGGGRDV